MRGGPAGRARRAPVRVPLLSPKPLGRDCGPFAQARELRPDHVLGSKAVARDRTEAAVGAGDHPRAVADAVDGAAQALGNVIARNKVGLETINCGPVKPTDAGFNVEDENDCALPGGDLNPAVVNSLRNEGGELDVLPIGASSPAVDRMSTGCPAGTLDARSLYRPQGPACDAGAYEIDKPATVTINEGPTGVVSPAVEALGRSHAGRLKVVKLDIDAAPAIAQRYGVMSIPTLLLLRDGQEVDRAIGALPEPALRAWLDDKLAAAATPHPAQSGATSP